MQTLLSTQPHQQVTPTGSDRTGVPEFYDEKLPLHTVAIIAWHGPKTGRDTVGRYGGRAKEVAARTVMKEHSEKGHENGK